MSTLIIIVAVMLACSVIIYAIGKGLFGRQTYAMMAKATHSGGARDLTRGSAWLCTLLFGGITFLAVLPHLGVVLLRRDAGNDQRVERRVDAQAPAAGPVAQQRQRQDAGQRDSEQHEPRPVGDVHVTLQPDEFELNLKYRGPDRYVAAVQDVSTAGKAKNDKLEEDVLPPFRGQFSRSATVEAAAVPEPPDVRRASEVFPGLGALGIPESTKVEVANGFKAFLVPFPSAEVKAGLTWTDTTTNEFKNMSGLDGTTKGVMTYTVVGDQTGDVWLPLFEPSGDAAAEVHLPGPWSAHERDVDPEDRRPAETAHERSAGNRTEGDT